MTATAREALARADATHWRNTALGGMIGGEG